MTDSNISCSDYSLNLANINDTGDNDSIPSNDVGPNRAMASACNTHISNYVTRYMDASDSMINKSTHVLHNMPSATSEMRSIPVKRQSNAKGIKLLHLNVRHHLPKHCNGELKVELDSINPTFHVLVYRETSLDDTIPSSDLYKFQAM